MWYFEYYLHEIYDFDEYKSNFDMILSTDIQDSAFVVYIVWYILFYSNYRQVSNMRHTKSQHLKDSCSVLRLSLPNPLKWDVK